MNEVYFKIYGNRNYGTREIIISNLSIFAMLVFGWSALLVLCNVVKYIVDGHLDAETIELNKIDVPILFVLSVVFIFIKVIGTDLYGFFCLTDGAFVRRLKVGAKEWQFRSFRIENARVVYFDRRGALAIVFSDGTRNRAICFWQQDDDTIKRIIAICQNGRSSRLPLILSPKKLPRRLSTAARTGREVDSY